MVPAISGRQMTVRTSTGWVAFWRIGFGLIWLVDAWFKWQPPFLNRFVLYLSGGISPTQPPWVNSWIHFWVDVVRVDPHLFAYLLAMGETAIALGLLTGVAIRLVAMAGSTLALVLWSAGEAFGGPYTAGATDIGTAIIYVGGFGLLALIQAGYAYGLDGTFHLTGWSWRHAPETDVRGGSSPYRG